MASQLTMLNSMASTDFEKSLEIHRAWGLQWLDLRDAIYGKWVKELDAPTARRAQAAIVSAQLRIYCLSTQTFFDDVSRGEAVFRDHLEQLKLTLQIAPILEPQIVRIVAAQLPECEPGASSVELMKNKYPWVIDVYREALDAIEQAGFTSTIENEAKRCFLSRADDFIGFFEWLDRPQTAHLTWDVQNHWSTGVFPTLEIYQQLKPLINYFHTKGGQTDAVADRLAWNVALEDASWPVRALTQAVINDGVSPVICLNPPQHGEQKSGYDYTDIPKRDVDYLRTNIEGIE